MENELNKAVKALKSVAKSMGKDIKFHYSYYYTTAPKLGYVKFRLNDKHNIIIVTNTSSNEQIEKLARIAIEEIC